MVPGYNLLSLQGWLNGISALLKLLIGCILGIFFIYQSKKSKARLLFYLGLTILFISFLHLGVSIDFLSILFFGSNLPFTLVWRIPLCYMWVAPVFIGLIYVGTTVIIPKRRWYAITPILILGIIYTILLLLDFENSFEVLEPVSPGSDLILASMVVSSYLFIIVLFAYISVIVINVIGGIYKSLKAEGIIKKKFLLLSSGTLIYTTFTMFESTTSFWIFRIIVRIGSIFGYLIIYLSLREEAIKKKVKIQKAIKVEGDLFRLYETKPDNVTEEEINFLHERKICLVCKGEAIKFTYICSNCNALYCMKCAKALINIENKCWACGSPIDESKPIKSIKKGEGLDFIKPEKAKK